MTNVIIPRLILFGEVGDTLFRVPGGVVSGFRELGSGCRFESRVQLRPRFVR